MRDLISPKVIAAGAGAGGGAAISAFIIWLLGVIIWGGSASASAATETAGLVPLPVTGVLFVLLAVAGAMIPGYVTIDPARTPPYVPQHAADDTPQWEAADDNMTDGDAGADVVGSEGQLTDRSGDVSEASV